MGVIIDFPEWAQAAPAEPPAAAAAPIARRSHVEPIRFPTALEREEADPLRVVRGLIAAVAYSALGILAVLAIAVALANFSSPAPVSCPADPCPVAP